MSNKTTYLGPRVSLNTVLSDQSAPHFHVPSDGTFTADGQAIFNDKLDASSATFLTESRDTTVVDTSSIEDNQLSVMSVDGLQAAIRFRSGNTVYTWASDSTSTVA